MLVLKDSLSGEDLDEGGTPAGGTKCISCGGGFAGGKPHTLGDGSSVGGGGSVSSASILPDSLGDYEQFVQVLNRNAGLKPLGRVLAPELPKTAHGRSRKETAQDPLYRKAKMAAQLREIPKIPMISMGYSASAPEQIFQMGGAAEDDNISLLSAISRKQTVGVLSRH
jgi:hypothetical protein